MAELFTYEIGPADAGPINPILVARGLRRVLTNRPSDLVSGEFYCFPVNENVNYKVIICGEPMGDTLIDDLKEHGGYTTIKEI